MFKLTLPKQQIFYSYKPKEFAYDNFKYDENDGKFNERVENTGKRRNCSLRAISPFPQCFQQTCKANM